jgi:lysophospholipase L1-like esterase
MIYKNFDIHNAAELIDNGDGSVSWRRVPEAVERGMEAAEPKRVVYNSTGVELRFVMRGETAAVRMSTYENNPESFATFHVYRGSVQGGWMDHEIHRHVTGEVEDFVIARSGNLELLRAISERCGYPFDPEVVRIIFDRGRYRIYDVIGDVTPPTAEQLPSRTLLAYGSSITHGSNSIDASHSWVSTLAHNLGMDALNLGMAGNCALEPCMADYIAAEGEAGRWDIATLELGINKLKWEDALIRSRAENMIRTVAGRNPDKQVFVISPFYYCGDDFKKDDRAKIWRNILRQTVNSLGYKNVTYIDGKEVLDGPEYMSADEVHPNIYGVARIAEVLTERIKSVL